MTRLLSDRESSRAFTSHISTIKSDPPTHHTHPGFTIIEVVLVLAIAGLIFLMIFVALPALQRAQRNTQRKQDMARIASQIGAWMSRNQANLSGNYGERNLSYGWNKFYNTYMEPADQYTDPVTGQKYLGVLYGDPLRATRGADPGAVSVGGSHPWPNIEVGEFQYVSNGWCEDGNILHDAAALGRTFVIRYKLEGGAYGCISGADAEE